LASYIRNTFTKINFSGQEVIITGGKYNKRVKSSDIIVEILIGATKLIEEKELFSILKKKFKIDYESYEKLILKLVKLGFLETNLIYSLDNRINIPSDINKIKSFNIPTCSRPSQLSKCIETYSNNFKKNSHKIDINIFDDTPLGESLTNYYILKEKKKYFNDNIYYVDLEEKEIFIDLITKKSGVEREVLEFGFLPNKLFTNRNIFNAGANRNFILAYTIGECFLTADDDSCCTGFINNSNLELQFSKGRADINKVNITKVDIEKACNIEEIDIVNYHEKYIGKKINEILLNKKIQNIECNMISENNAIFPNNYKLFEDSKIHFTFNTMFGWPDESSDEILYGYLNDKNIEHLIGYSNNYIFESMASDTIYSNPFLLTTTLTAIDNRFSICPFIPVNRNEDIHYSYILNYLDPFSLSGAINLSLLHDKKRNVNQLEAFYKNFYTETVLSYVLNIVLNKLKIDMSKKIVDIEIRKKILGDAIKNICGRNRTEFTSNLLDTGVDLEKLWHEKRQLAREVNKQLGNDENQLSENEFLRNFQNFLDNEEWEFIRITFILYSKLLLRWSYIMEVCLDLKNNGLLPRKKI
jgi:hypothetical protein